MGSHPGEERDTTELLMAVRAGAPYAMDVLMTRVYDELRRVAHRQLAAERTGHTFDTTGLVHETWLRLVDQRRTQWADRQQFFALAARMMRRVLVDYARRYDTLKRGGGLRRVPLEVVDGGADDTGGDSSRRLDVEPAAADRAEELLALDEALKLLEQADARAARVVEMRYFAGLTEVEIAELLGVTERTVRRDWVRARDWLYAEVRRALA